MTHAWSVASRRAMAAGGGGAAAPARVGHTAARMILLPCQPETLARPTDKHAPPLRPAPPAAGPAQRAGVPCGARIVAVQGVATSNREQLRRALAGTVTGEAVLFSLEVAGTPLPRSALPQLALPAHPPVSAPCQQLLCALLEPCPKARMDFGAFWSHPLVALPSWEAAQSLAERAERLRSALEQQDGAVATDASPDAEAEAVDSTGWVLRFCHLRGLVRPRLAHVTLVHLRRHHAQRHACARPEILRAETTRQVGGEWVGGGGGGLRGGRSRVPAAVGGHRGGGGATERGGCQAGRR
jgi:hypothetical protein